MRPIAALVLSLLLAAAPTARAPLPPPTPPALALARARLALAHALPEIVAPVRAAFRRARAGAPAFARWANSSWTGASLACSAAADWWEERPPAEARTARLVRDRFAADVLAPAGLDAALRLALDDARARLEAARLETFLAIDLDCTDLLAAGAPVGPPLPSVPAHDAPAAHGIPVSFPLAAPAALLYRAADLGTDAWITTALAPLLPRLAARLGVRLTSLGAGFASAGLALLVTLILEYLYDAAVEGGLTQALDDLLLTAEHQFIDAPGGLVESLQAIFDTRFAVDAEAISARVG